MMDSFDMDENHRKLEEWSDEKSKLSNEEREYFLGEVIRFLLTQQIEDLEWANRLEDNPTAFWMSAKEIKITDIDQFINLFLDKRTGGFLFDVRVNELDDDMAYEDIEHLLVRIDT